MDFVGAMEPRTMLCMGEPKFMPEVLTPSVANGTSRWALETPVTQGTQDKQEGRSKAHRVVLNVTTVIASLKGSDEQSKLIDELPKRTKRTLESPKPQQFFHCEYNITPTQERTVVDIVSYGIAAKVFSENDSRVIKTWDDGEKIWVAWVNSHELFVTEEDILDIYDHTLFFKLWDSKYKVSDRARYDRPKAFRIPVAKGANPGQGVADLLAKQSRSWTVLQSKDPSAAADQRDEKRRSSEGEAQNLCEVQPTSDRMRKSVGRLAGIKVAEKRRMHDLKVHQSKILKEPNKKQIGAKREEKAAEILEMKEIKKSAAESMHLRRLTVPIKLELLFSGSKEITSRLEYPSVNVQDIFVSVSVTGRLIPENLERKFNPLTIAIKSLKDLPDTPVPRNRLSVICQPVYCSYKFLDQPLHKTPWQSHNKDICFEDIHVILAGMLDRGRLYEFLHSDGLNIRVHDRDRKLPAVVRHNPMVFGDDEDDKRIANLGLVSTKCMSHNAAHDHQQRVCDSFGTAKVGLRDFLRGNTTLLLEAAVNPCIPQNSSYVNAAHHRAWLVGKFGSLELPQQPPLPVGDYLSSGTVLKVKFSLKYPLSWKFSPKSFTSLETSTSFARIIYHFSFKNKDMLHALETFVMKSNFDALGLDQLNGKVAESTLSTYKLSENQRKSTTLDIVTGIHIMDGESHIFILEGLRSGAMKRLQEEIGHGEHDDEGFLLMLIDTSIGFNTRLYAELDMNLYKVLLHRPLKSILVQPLLYVRDLLPRSCFQCLMMLKDVVEASCLKDVCQSASFPTHEMVTSMSAEFGISITRLNFEHRARHGDDKRRPDTLIQEKCTVAMQAHSKNKQLYRLLRDQKKYENRRPDFILSNMVSVQEAGRRRRPASRIYVDISGSSFAHASNPAKQSK